MRDEVKHDRSLFDGPEGVYYGATNDELVILSRRRLKLSIDRRTRKVRSYYAYDIEFPSGSFHQLGLRGWREADMHFIGKF